MANDAHPQSEPTEKLSEEPPLRLAASTGLGRGDILAARYEIQALLGSGGMASVYQAFDRVTEETIAIKVLSEDRSAARGWVEQLGRELRLARRIKHPNVCQVFDFFENDGRCFLTMELAPGGTLRDALERGPGARPLAERLADARAVIDGVAAIHQAGVVHRDLKPENVLRAADGRLMVSDLGVAVRVDMTTHSAGPAGTRSYMAPELVFGDKATKTSDVWSLGVVLHETLFGCRPEWSLAGDVRRLNAPEGVSAPPLRELLTLCGACLVELPGRRLRDGEAVKSRFEEVLNGRRSRRGWRIAVAAAATLALLGGGFAVARRSGGSGPGSILRGNALELADHSVRLASFSRNVTRCAQLLPGGKALRLFLKSPAEAVDVDLGSGATAPAKLVPEAVVSGCAQVSPDGRRLLYESPRQEGRPWIMLSERPDGGDARLVTEGDGPFWLASGDAFLYAMDITRSAVFQLGRGPLLFPASSLGPRRLASHAVNAAGDRIAMVYVMNTPTSKMTLDVFSYPDTNLMTRIDLPLKAFPWVEFDRQRGSWQLSVRELQNLVRCEPRDDGTCDRILRMKDADVIASYRSPFGLVALVNQFSRSALVTRKADGKRQEYAYQSWGADIGPNGEAVYGLMLSDGRVVIAMERFGDSEPRILTKGPMDVAPAISPDGRTFLYSGGGGRDVYLCSMQAGADDCRVIHSDPLAPVFARLSPDGRLLAFNVSDAGGWRLRIVPLDGGKRSDLSVRAVGPSLWTSPTTLWNCQQDAKTWSEVDAATGRFTGKILSRPEVDTACEPPPGLGDPTNFEVRRKLNVTTEVRLVRGM